MEFGLNLRKPILVLAIAALAATLALAGCASPAGRPSGNEGGDANDAAGDEVTLILYFPDSQAMHLEKEERTVTADPGDTYETLAIKALIDGPRTDGHLASIPEGSELISVEVKDSVAYVNMNEAFRDNHGGGSTGETMTIYSIVDTLTESGEISGVKILIGGEEIETLAGHYDLTQVFDRNEEILAGN